MALDKIYTQEHKKLGEFFGKIREAQTPERFTTEHLKDLGYTSNNDRMFIPIMKKLKFLTPEGIPTARYTEYRDYSKSKQIMGEAIKETYRDIFLINSDPTSAPKELITRKFRYSFKDKDTTIKLMVSTFYALLALADLKATQTTKGGNSAEESKISGEGNPTEESEFFEDDTTPSSALQNNIPELHYTIQIHLPATKDLEIYNAIFKSLKEHLF